MPRPRATVRTLIVVIAVIAIAMAIVHRRQTFQEMAGRHRQHELVFDMLLTIRGRGECVVDEDKIVLVKTSEGSLALRYKNEDPERIVRLRLEREKWVQRQTAVRDYHA